jgi:cell wall-associated NlpC family hydrolase
LNGPEEFVRQARKLLGAKWRHRGRKPWAVDCVGLLALAGAKSGLVAADVEGYGREPWDQLLERGCRERWGDPVPLEQARAGDVAIFRWGRGEPSHIGVLGDHPEGGLTLIHSHNLRGVVECSLRGRYLEAIVEVYRTRFA